MKLDNPRNKCRASYTGFPKKVSTSSHKLRKKPNLTHAPCRIQSQKKIRQTGVADPSTDEQTSLIDPKEKKKKKDHDAKLPVN